MYGREANFVYYINIPSESSLDGFIDKYKKDESYWGFFGNCADSVSSVLNSGGHPYPDFSDGWFDFVSYPEELREYLINLNNPYNKIIKDSSF